MTRFYGVVGYGETVETPSGSGVYKDQITEHSYYGDVIRNSRQIQEGEFLNNDLSVSNSISIVADEYAWDHILNLRYIRWAGVNWKVANVTVERPRLVLRLGGKYNGPTPS